MSEFRYKDRLQTRSYQTSEQVEMTDFVKREFMTRYVYLTRKIRASGLWIIQIDTKAPPEEPGARDE